MADTRLAKDRMIAHVAILVKDLDQAYKDYKEILEVLAPDMVKNIVRMDDFAEGEETIPWITFVSEHCQIQLMQPTNPDGYLYKLLEKRGEGVHHVAFTSNDVEETFEELKKKGIPLTHEKPVEDPNLPGIKYTFVHFKKAHGVLLEVAQRYKFLDNKKWVPDKGDV